MNPSREPQINEDTKENLTSNGAKSNSDSNANLSLTSTESKGAIPKRKFTKISTKKTNNNVSGFYIESNKQNGFCKETSSSTSSYLNNSSYNEPSQSQIILKKPDLESSPIIEIEQELTNPSYMSIFKPHKSLIDLTEECISSSAYLENHNQDSDSSSDDNELLSVSDDGCIYTYKGDHMADLPSSFFNLEIPVLENVEVERREENSSPEMDFLEMDFDPGPSGGDADSNSDSNCEIDNNVSLPLDPRVENLVIEDPQPCCSKDITTRKIPEVEPNICDTSKVKYSTTLRSEITKTPLNICKVEVKMPWSCSVSERTRASKTLRIIKKHHGSKGELSSPIENLNGDNINLSNLTTNGKILIDDKITIFSDIEKNMIWSQQEACLKQITQVGPSACGTTAVLNVLSALGFPIPTIEKVQECVNTKYRANSSPLTEYLLSRSKAGCNHCDLIRGLAKISNRQIYSRFFAMYPEKLVNLQSWLGYWIKNGAIPIATLNLQKCEGNIPDSWHHQMIFGVGPEGIFLTNPLECVDPQQLWPQLSSESVLLIRTEDIISRWNPAIDLPQLIKIDDVRWKELNVVGQIVKVIRESRREARVDYVFTSHIKIPADYKAGITLVVNMDSPAFNLLRQSPELPLLQPDISASAF